MALAAGALDTAETCLAATGDLPLLRCVRRLKAMPHAEVRGARLAALCRRTQQAETMLLQVRAMVMLAAWACSCPCLGRGSSRWHSLRVCR